MQVSYIDNNNQPSFGVQYTRNSIKTLYKLLPYMSEQNEFYYSKKALENLIKAKKRNDNLLLDIREDEHGYNLFNFFVKHLSNKSGIFKQPVLSPSASEYNSYAEDFLEYTEFINSNKFVKESNRVIFNDYQRQAKLPLWKKFKEAIIRKTNINIWVPEILETIELTLRGAPMIFVHPDGTQKNVSGLHYLIESIKSVFSPKEAPQKPFQIRLKDDKDTLSKLINELAT